MQCLAVETREDAGWEGRGRNGRSDRRWRWRCGLSESDLVAKGGREKPLDSWVQGCWADASASKGLLKF